MDSLELKPLAPRARKRAAAGLEEHFQPRAAARRACAGRDRDRRPARRRRHARHAGGARAAWALHSRSIGDPWRVGGAVPGQEGRALPRQRRHRVAPAHRGARAFRRRVPPVGRAAHARAPDRRSGRCAARHRRAHRLRRQARAFRRSRFTLATISAENGAGARRRVVAVPDRAAHGAAARRQAARDRGAGRAHLQALRRDHAQRDAPLRRRGRAHRLEHASRCRACAYRSPGRILVEGDASSASYFLAAGALGGGPVRVEGVGRDSIQGDVRFTEVLERMGARACAWAKRVEVSNPGDGSCRRSTWT